MILEYEGSFFSSFAKWFKEFKQVMYAPQETLFDLDTKAIQCPSAYYNRGEFNMPRLREIHFQENEGDFKGIPMILKYVGYILIEKQSDAYKWHQKILEYFDENAYIPASINQESGYNDVEVAQRLLYIKLDEQRTKRDLKGPMRAVEFSWMVQLMVTNASAFKASLIKKVIIGINNQIEFEYE